MPQPPDPPSTSLTPRPYAPYLTWFWWRHSQGGPHCEYVMCESGCIRLVGKWMAWLNRNTLYYFICSSTKTAYKRVRPVSIFPEFLLYLILTCHWPATNIWYLQFSAATWWGKWNQKKKTKSQHATFKAGRTDSWHQLITQSARALCAPQQFLLYFLPHEQEKHTHTHTYT